MRLYIQTKFLTWSKVINNLSTILNIFYKDWKAELRSKYSFNSLVMFILVTISVIVFSIVEQNITPYITISLFWVVMFFSIMSGLSRIFISEEEKGTSLILSLISLPDNIFIGKLIFNVILIFFINFIVLILFLFFFDSFIIKNYFLFVISLILGNIGIASTSTIIAAIISKASYKSNLYTILSFPLLLPLIMILIELTKQSIDGNAIIDNYAELGILFSYLVIIITASILLFEFIWKD